MGGSRIWASKKGEKKSEGQQKKGEEKMRVLEKGGVPNRRAEGKDKQGATQPSRKKKKPIVPEKKSMGGRNFKHSN